MFVNCTARHLKLAGLSASRGQRTMTYAARTGTFTPEQYYTYAQNPPKQTQHRWVSPFLRIMDMDAVLTPDGLDQDLTTAEASRIFGVAAATIRKWAQLGKIHPSGIDRAGRKLYKLRHIAQYEKETRIRSGRENRERRLGLRISA